MNENCLTLTLQVKIILNLIMVSLASFLTYIGIDQNALAMYTLLLFIDYITGIKKAHALKEHINSHKMKYGIMSKLYLLFIPIALSVASKATPLNISHLVSISLTLLVLSELYSIIANIYTARKGVELPEWEILSILSRNIRDFSMAIFSK